MTATLLYRIAAVVFILFAVGHTIGFLTFRPSNAEGVTVMNSMSSVRLAVGSGTRTYNDFYRGFGLFCTLYLLFAAYLAWHLGALAKSSPQAIGGLGWTFFAVQIVSVVLSWIYFLPPPGVLSAVAALLTAWAAWLVRPV